LTDSLIISTGQKRLPITRDGEPVGEIIFNPNDVVFAEKFYRLIGELQKLNTQYEVRAKAIDNDDSMDENGIPANTTAKLEMMREVCEYLREQIDGLFGAGTSTIVFGNAMTLDPFEQFFTGLTPFIQSVRSSKVAKYTNTKARK